MLDLNLKETSPCYWLGVSTTQRAIYMKLTVIIVWSLFYNISLETLLGRGLKVLVKEVFMKTLTLKMV